MTPSSVKAITGSRSSQRSRSATWVGAATDPPSIDLIIRRLRPSAGEAVADPIAVRQPQRGSDLQAQPRQDDLRLLKVALNVGSGVPPQVVLRRGVAYDPDRDRTADRIIGPAFDQLAAVDIRQLQIDQDQGGDTVANEGIRFLAGARVLEGDAIAAKLHQIKLGEILIVVDQENPSLPRHTCDIKRASLRVALRIRRPAAYGFLRCDRHRRRRRPRVRVHRGRAEFQRPLRPPSGRARYRSRADRRSRQRRPGPWPARPRTSGRGPE